MRLLFLILGLSWPWASPGETLVPSVATNATTGGETMVPSAPVLKGTILTGRAADARAIIIDGSGRQQVYARGDEIPPGASIVEIHRTYVVLRRDGRLEKIDLSRRSAEPVSESAADKASSNTSPADSPEGLRAAMLAHPEQLLQRVGATEAVASSRFGGYRVVAPPDPALLASLGLQPGDILTKVNGVPLSTPDHEARLADALSGARKLTFTIRRGNRTLILSH